MKTTPDILHGFIARLAVTLYLSTIIIAPATAHEPVHAEVSTPSVELPAHYNHPILAVRNNLLYDALAVPNIGIEFNLGHGWTVGADAFYAWWNKSDMSRVWRWQGAELDTRRYFGHHGRQLTGWFVGAYAQMLRYDVLLGHSGSLSGGAATGFFNHPTLGGGLMVGYTLGIGSNLAIDFSIGAGYLTGRYQTYRRTDGVNLWKSTADRRYFGPSRAEINIVWFLRKGGRK